MDLKTAERLAGIKQTSSDVIATHNPPENPEIAGLTRMERFAALGRRIMTSTEFSVPTETGNGRVYSRFTLLPGDLALRVSVATYERVPLGKEIEFIEIKAKWYRATDDPDEPLVQERVTHAMVEDGIGRPEAEKRLSLVEESVDVLETHWHR